MRWETVLGFVSGDAVTVGWLSKAGGRPISDAGREALDAYQAPEELYEKLYRRWREISARRKRALEALSEDQQFVATTLQLVEAGYRTAHDDLAELADKGPAEVAYFLASASVKMPASCRVLTADGTIPEESLQHVDYRGTGLRRRLTREGVGFDAPGRAAQTWRLTARALKELRDARRESEEEEAITPVKRAWMIRGTSVDGYSLVPDWLRDGFVSPGAAQLGHLDAGISYDALKEAVETACRHKSYAYRGAGIH